MATQVKTNVLYDQTKESNDFVVRSLIWGREERCCNSVWVWVWEYDRKAVPSTLICIIVADIKI